jgi:hypothetical protein
MREQGRPTRVDRSSAKCFVNCCLAGQSRAREEAVGMV